MTPRAAKADLHQRQALEAVWNSIHLFESVAKGAGPFQKSAAAHLEALTKQLESTSSTGDRVVAAPVRDSIHARERAFLVRAERQGRARLSRQAAQRRAGICRVRGHLQRSESFIAGRMRVYVPALKRHSRVLDIGCGRGEMLDLLRDAGVPEQASTLMTRWWRGAAEKGMPLNGGTPSRTCANSWTRRSLRSSPPRWSSTCRMRS